MLTTRKKHAHLLHEQAEQLLMGWVNLGDGVGLDRVPERLKAATRLMLSFPETFQLSREGRDELLRLDAVEEPTDDQLDQLELLDNRLLFVEQVRELLRRVWQLANQRDREWLIFLIRAAHDRWMHSPPRNGARGFATIRIEQNPETGEPTAYEDKTVDRLTSRRDFRRSGLRNYLRRRSSLGDLELTFDLGMEVQAPEPNTFERVMHHFQRNEDRARRCANPECPAPYFFSGRQGQRYCGTDCSGKAHREQNREWARRNRNAAKTASTERSNR